VDNTWRKSTRCDTGACVEAALIEGSVHIRDPQTTTELTVSAAAWQQFIEGVKNGEFDREP
jgi:predicted secreted Zn-dependent protease